MENSVGRIIASPRNFGASVSLLKSLVSGLQAGVEVATITQKRFQNPEYFSSTDSHPCWSCTRLCSVDDGRYYFYLFIYLINWVFKKNKPHLKSTDSY